MHVLKPMAISIDLFQCMIASSNLPKLVADCLRLFDAVGLTAETALFMTSLYVLETNFVSFMQGHQAYLTLLCKVNFAQYKLR